MSTTIILVIAIVSALLYLLAALMLTWGKHKTFAYGVWIAAVAGNAFLVANNWVINGYVPFVSMYQVLTFLAIMFAPIYLYVRFWHGGGWMDKCFCIAPAVCLTGVCFMGFGSVWHFAPALQSIWFVPHILAYMIAYSLCAVAFILCLISFFDKKNRAKLDKGIYDLICTAFPFMTCGMFFGSIWANEVWGNFWSFDAKENWSLVTWLMYAVYLHFRRHKTFQKYAKLFAILGFIGIVITMLFVNIMGGSSNHSYSV